MKVQVNRNRAGQLVLGLVLVLASVVFAPAQGTAPPCVPAANEDAVLEWNCRAMKYALSSTFSGALRQIRAMTLVQLSVSNAVNAISRDFETFGRNEANTPPDKASQEAAAVGAAYQALYALVTPAQRATLNVELAESLANRGIPSNDPSLIFGMGEGQNIVNLRTGDGSGPEAQCAYTDIVNPQPGQWIRIVNVNTGVAPAAATPCWRFVPTFVLHSAEQFPLEDPPALDSELYLTDLSESKNFGGQNADTQRQDWQSRIADFWDGPPIAITNQAIRQAAQAKDMSLSAEARALALVYLAGMDATVACWQYKYTKLFWRPETTVNNTLPLPSAYWKPYLFPTHPHPEYPSGHSTNSGSLFTAAALVFGDKPGVTMTPTITRNGISVTPQWESFSQAINEVIDARVYSGLHFRFTDERSANLGRRIAHFVFTHALRKCNKGNKCE
jgi:hypothetical protein